MAFRVAGKVPVAPKGAAAPQEEDPKAQVDPQEAAEDPQEEAAETPEEEAAEGDDSQDQGKDGGGGPVDQQIAGYMGPDQGPFMCGNCVYFNEDSTCKIVSGSIDHMGCCNLFTSAGMAQGGADQGQTDEQEPPPDQQEEQLEEPPQE